MSGKFMIYSIHHEEEKYPAYRSDVVKSIFVGKRPQNPRTDIDIYDDTGDNISKKNYTYSEFTGTYWAWKNSDADYIGIMHYRRALNFNYQGYPAGDTFCQLHGLTKKRLEMVFSETDIAVGEPMYLYNTIYNQYASSHTIIAKEIFSEIKNYISKKYPKMLDTFQSHFYEYNQPAYFKCQIMAKRQIFNEYMEFVFGIFGHLEDKLGQNLKNVKRIYAFIGERLMSLFIQHCINSGSHKVKCYPIAFYDTLDKYKDYRNNLLEQYSKLMQSEPTGYLRHMFYHHKVNDSRDQRVSLNINFIDHNNREFSAIMRNGKFERYKLNTSQNKQELDSLPVISNERHNIKLCNKGFCIDDSKENVMHFRYKTSGTLDLYDAYFTYWNEPEYNYKPQDKSLCQKVIFVFHNPRRNEYSVSSRLYVRDVVGEQKSFFYLEAEHGAGSYKLSVCHVSDSTKEQDKYTSEKTICCLDGENRSIKLELSQNGFCIDGKAPVLTVQLQDWEGSVFEVSMAKWFYYETNFMALK